MYLISCDLKLTENPGKLIKDLKNFFPDSEFEILEGKIIGDTDLKFFKSLCEKQQSELPLKILSENKELKLDKIAMHDKKIEICEDFPLGCVVIKE